MRFLHSGAESFVVLGVYCCLVAIRLSVTADLEAIKCPLGFMMCGDRETCVEEYRRCDGVVDCPGADDEAFDCGSESSGRKNNPYNSVEPSDAREVIPLMDSNCTEMADGCDETMTGEETQFPCAFRNLPRTCKCHPGEDGPFNLLCWTNSKLIRLNAVKPSPVQLTIMDINRNLSSLFPISEQKGVYSSMNNLISMKFSHNGLRTILPMAFRHHNLATVDLSYNNLTLFLNGTFAGLNVCTLFLENNSLVDWYPDTFAKNSSIMWLDLMENRVTLERPGMLRNLIHTVLIDLRGNKVSRLKNGTFNGMRELRNLDLSMNRISVIEPDAFDGAEQLRTLNLSHNLITHLPENLFHRNSQLRHLELAYNPIEFIPENLFRNFNCTTLDLRGVEIKNINEAMFRSLAPSCVVMFEKLYYCFSAPQIRNCTPKSDGISSFEDLLVSPLLVTLAWMLGIFTIVSNLAVFSARWYLDSSIKSGIHDMVVRDARVMSLFVKHLSCESFLCSRSRRITVATLCAFEVSDLLTGVYLLGICYHNELSRGTTAQTPSNGCTAPSAKPSESSVMEGF
ncbi:putative Relaxin receptor 1 [Hypsibius exemplaris]|uniref:Relaxin receptor 1 n=2 Tax=Hypsibius exemplaris TaxID=2072580 RepID=A0A1W0WCI4_HYPEX|nr:putative Relaxin receptor 1 [Hypsibius exemplaris]